MHTTQHKQHFPFPSKKRRRFRHIMDTVTTPSPHRSSPLQNISPSILIMVTVLAVTVIVSVFICFLLRHLNSRSLRRLSADPTPPSFTAPTSSEILPSSSSVIDSLPLFTFSSVTRRTSATTAADCAVCLSKFHNNDLLRRLPLCCHAFHAECIDTWLRSNLSCPLCRSNIFPSDSDLAKILRSPSSDSFRVEIGNISRRGTTIPNPESAADARSYSIGSFEYYIAEPSEVSIADQKEFPSSEDLRANETVVTTAATTDGVAGSGHWLKDYVDRLSASISSRTASFRSSGRFFSNGNSRRIEPLDYDVEGNRIGEEISEMFRWLSGE